MFRIKFVRTIIRKVPSGLMSIFISVLIAYVSLDGDPFDVSRVPLFEGADKVVHALMYCVLASVLIFDNMKYRYPRKTGAFAIWVCAAVAFAFSVLMEVLQDAMGLGRAASMEDVAANLSGVVLGLLFMKCVFMKRFDEIMRSE